MLALIVGGATAIPTIAGFGDNPWVNIIVPSAIKTGHHIAMPVGHNRWQIVTFLAARHQNRSGIGARVGVGFACKADIGQIGDQIFLKIGGKGRPAVGANTFGSIGNPARQFGFKHAIMKIGINLRQRFVTSH